MNSAGHVREAERLLLDCQLAPSTSANPAVYPDSEEGKSTTRNALVAALVHAVLANALRTDNQIYRDGYRTGYMHAGGDLTKLPLNPEDVR